MPDPKPKTCGLTRRQLLHAVAAAPLVSVPVAAVASGWHTAPEQPVPQSAGADAASVTGQAALALMLGSPMPSDVIWFL